MPRLFLCAASLLVSARTAPPHVPVYKPSHIHAYYTSVCTAPHLRLCTTPYTCMCSTHSVYCPSSVHVYCHHSTCVAHTACSTHAFTAPHLRLRLGGMPAAADEGVVQLLLVEEAVTVNIQGPEQLHEPRHLWG